MKPAIDTSLHPPPPAPQSPTRAERAPEALGKQPKLPPNLDDYWGRIEPTDIAGLDVGRGKRAFIREFLRNPKELGTFSTSSASLARAVTRDMGLESAKVVVELGAGSGALTEDILKLVPRQSRVIAIELTLGLARSVKARFPSVHVWREDATNVRSVCEREGIALGTIDAVVSSLPFLLMPDGIRGRILHETAAVLRPGGRFVMLTYRPEKFFPSVRRFRAQMQAEFTSVRMARFVPLNFPPAFVYRCER